MSEKEVKPSQEVIDLSEKIQKQTHVNNSHWTAKDDQDPYYDNLPDTLTKEQDQAVDQYRTLFIASAARAQGLQATEYLKENKEVDTVTGDISMGSYNRIKPATERHSTYTFGSGADKKVIEKKGQMTVKVEIHGADNSGQLKKVRQEIAQAAANIL